MNATPLPLEETDPELAKLFVRIANDESPIKTLIIRKEGHLILLKNGRVVAKKYERNSLCACGSGKKYKKCCGK